MNEDPVSNVQWVPIDKVESNDYNPNVVATNELYLLHHSIQQDGYTQPVVTVYDKDRDKYVIVDGFHRYLVMKTHEDIAEPRNHLLPVVVLDKPINDRMASTVRHNRARGKHNVSGMANLVFSMLDGGWKDEDILKELGMEADELLRLKHVTGFSKLFENVEYRQSWETREQIQIKRDYMNEDNDGEG
jgi:ParB-like chromosome segregation protein Spo0J